MLINHHHHIYRYQCVQPIRRNDDPHGYITRHVPLRKARLSTVPLGLLIHELRELGGQQADFQKRTKQKDKEVVPPHLYLPLAGEQKWEVKANSEPPHEQLKEYKPGEVTLPRDNPNHVEDRADEY